MELNNYKVKVLENNKLTGNIYQLWLELLDGDNFDFKPGQYVLVEKDMGEGLVRRAYSISSTGYDLPRIELTVRRYEDGKMSPYLTERRAGDILNIVGPYGMFSEEKRKSDKVVMVAIGCGVAPLKSMIDNWSRSLDQKLEVSLFYGNRYADQISYHDWLLNMARRWNNFHYYPCVSRLENKIPGIYEGRVNEVIKREHLDFENSDFYLCGSKEMLADARQAILGSGGKEENVYFENIMI